MHELAAKFFNVTLATPVKVDVPEIGDAVYVKPFSGSDLDAWEVELVKRRGKDEDAFDMAGLRATLVKLTICDGAGALLFADDTIERINQMPGKLLESLYKAAKSANGLDIKSQEDSEKN